MAKATVWFQFEDHDWQGPFGEGSSTMTQGNGPEKHAERVAWREAQAGLKAWHDKKKEAFKNAKVNVKIKVDQIVCPSCQLWMIAGVLRNLETFSFKPSLYVEVETSTGKRLTGEITRDYRWPVGIGHFDAESMKFSSTLDLLKNKGVSING